MAKDGAIIWEVEGYDPGISVQEWIDLLEDPEIFTEEIMEIMKRMKDYGGAATCTQLANKYGKEWRFYKDKSVAFARSIAKVTRCPIYSDQKGEWPFQVLYYGRKATRSEAGTYVWKLRDELSLALDQIDLSGVPLYADLPADEEQFRPDGDLDLKKMERAARQYSREHPAAQVTTTRQFHRSKSVERYAKARANGICQLCGQTAPFRDGEGSPYLECHHIVWLARGGSDTVENTVALCPNCHRKMHVIQDPSDIDRLRETAMRGPL